MGRAAPLLPTSYGVWASTVSSKLPRGSGAKPWPLLILVWFEAPKLCLVTRFASCLPHGSTTGHHGKPIHVCCSKNRQNLCRISGRKSTLYAYRTSPVCSLQVLAHEPPLELRREQLLLQYCTKLKSNTLNPTHKTVFQPLSSLYRNKPNAISSFGLRIQTSIAAINIIKLNITPSRLSPIPPWLLTTRSYHTI